MTDNAPTLTPTQVAQTTKNIRLAGRFMREVLADPTLLERTPDGSTLMLLPNDDPDLAAANLDLATRITERGQEVRLQLVGAPIPDAEQWRPQDRRGFEFREMRPRWPDQPPAEQDLRVVYDGRRDVLRIDLYAGGPKEIAVPLNDPLLVLIDLESQEAFGYLVPDFLARAVRRSPRVATILAVADLRSLGIDELGGLVEPEDEGGPINAESPEPTAPALREQIVATVVDDLHRMSA